MYCVVMQMLPDTFCHPSNFTGVLKLYGIYCDSYLNRCHME